MYSKTRLFCNSIAFIWRINKICTENGLQNIMNEWKEEGYQTCPYDIDMLIICPRAGTEFHKVTSATSMKLSSVILTLELKYVITRSSRMLIYIITSQIEFRLSIVWYQIHKPCLEVITLCHSEIIYIDYVWSHGIIWVLTNHNYIL